jgi:hypothetical protein
MTMAEPPGAAAPRVRSSPLARISDLGAAVQASIPGAYAWAVTVAPAAWSRGASVFPKITAVIGLFALAASLVVEHRRPEDAQRARAIAVWGLSLSSALTWLLVPSAMSTLHVDTARGLAGLVGWALFAFACAAPPVRRDESAEARVVEGPPLRPRARLARGDVALLTLGAVLACALQAVGWPCAPAARAVLVRLVALACGLAILGAAASVALARHIRRAPFPRKERLRRALQWLGALSLLVTLRLLAMLVAR